MVEVIGDHDLNLEKLQRVLVVAPHPDDEVLGCGGFISVLKREGLWVGVIFITRGEKASDPKTRTEEALAVKDLLGYDMVEFWNYPDGDTANHKREIKERLKAFLIEREIDLALCPAPYDFHPDHRNLGEICFELHLELYPKRFAFYSIYTNLIGNFSVDVSKEVQKIRDCLKLYKYSTKEVPEVVETSITYRRFNACILRYKGSYFESYLLLRKDWDAKEFIKYLVGEFFTGDCMFYNYTEVKHVHHVIGYASYLEERIEMLNSTLSKLEEKHMQIEEQYAKLMDRCKELEKELYTIKGSKFYRVMKSYYKIRDRLLPPNTRLRKVYDRLMGNV